MVLHNSYSACLGSPSSKRQENIERVVLILVRALLGPVYDRFKSGRVLKASFPHPLKSVMDGAREVARF